MDEETFEGLKGEHGNFEKPVDREVLETELTAIGIFGIMDPLRDGIEESIRLCKHAGIRVIMCTGDNIDTAIAISKNAGILEPGEENITNSCLIGQDFRKIVGKDLIKVEDPRVPG